MLKDLEGVIKSLGEKEKYTLIVEKARYFMLRRAIDITAKVISSFNEATKKKPTK